MQYFCTKTERKNLSSMEIEIFVHKLETLKSQRYFLKWLKHSHCENARYVWKVDNQILKFLISMNFKAVKNILKKDSKVGRVTLPNFTTQYKHTIIERAWCYYKNKTLDNCNEPGSPEINLHFQLFFDKAAKKRSQGRRTAFNDVGLTRWPHTKKMNFNLYFIAQTKKSKWIKDVNAQTKVPKYLIFKHTKLGENV